MALVKVRYKGISDERTIRVSDAASVGVKIPKDLVWNRYNGFAVDMELDEDAERMIRAQGHFSIEAINDTNQSVEVVAPTDTRSEGDVLVDGNTGASTETKKSN